MRDCYIAGNPWFQCDRCGEQRRLTERRKEWSGLVVCPACCDPRPVHMDPPNIYPEGQPIPDARPFRYDFITDPVTANDL